MNKWTHPGKLQKSKALSEMREHWTEK